MTFEDALDSFAEKTWKEAFEQAKQELEARRKNLNVGITDAEKDNKVLGKLVAVFDAREWVWLKEQYGDDCFADKDFLRFYQKAREQKGLLASV
jgi:hypothetical protein